MWVSPGIRFEIEVNTPEGKGVVIGWGQEKDFEAIPADEVIVKLKNDSVIAFKPSELVEVSTTLVL